MTSTAPQLDTATPRLATRLLIDPSLLVGLVIGAWAGGVLYACTVWGLGISHDSTVYYESARRLNQGLGLTLLSPEGNSVPMTHFPPLYPLLLALGTHLGTDENGIARLLGALFLGANVLAAAVIAGRYTRSTAASALAGLLVAASPDVLRVHGFAWTEPPFLLGWLIGAALLAVHLHRPAWGTLIASAVAISIAFLSRYVGITLVGTCCLAILLMHRAGWRRRLLETVVFAAIAWIPVGLWLLRNQLVRGSATNRQLGYQPMNADHFRELAATLANWVWPFSLPLPVAIILSLMLLAGAIALQVAHRRWARRSSAQARRPLRALPAVLWLFVCVYMGFLILSISYIDHATPLDSRILVPVFLSAALASVLQVSDLVSDRRRRVQLSVVTGALAVVGLYIGWAGNWLRDVYNDGLGYNHKRFVESTMWEQIAALPPGNFYTNDISLVRYYTGRAGYLVPRGDEAWREPGDHDALRRIRRKLATEGGYYAHFRHREALRPSQSEIVEFLALERIGRDKVGFLFERKPSRRFQRPPSDG